MPEYQRRHIAVSPQERLQLEQAKKRYEAYAGQVDWGKFLATTVLLGLGAVGVYALVKATQRTDQSVDVACCECGGAFLMAVPEGTSRAVIIRCPYCGHELVVDLGQ